MRFRLGQLVRLAREHREYGNTSIPGSFFGTEFPISRLCDIYGKGEKSVIKGEFKPTDTILMGDVDGEAFTLLRME